MATRSTISITKADGSIYKIYCHWDGYIEGVGKILKEHYTDINKIEQLIELGSISSLDKECSKPETHTFDKPVDGFTVAYHRDRNEPWDRVKPEKFDSFEMFRLSGDWQEYNYVYKDGKWLVKCGERTGGFIEY